VSDLPCIMSAPMVLATLREIEAPGTGETMTRRMAWGARFAKAIDDEGGYPGWRWGQWRPGTCAWPGAKTLERLCLPTDTQLLIGHMAPSIWQNVKPGDRLWVRENLCAMGNWGLWHDAGPIPKQGQFLDDLDERGRAILERYAPTEATDSARVPSIHMPRWASRLTLLVTATKIERLQDISEADAIAEGSRTPLAELPSAARKAAWSERQAFKHIWDAIHGPDAWDANPEVVAVTFKPVLANIDALPKQEVA
jgi:hypothetical protein